MKDSLVLSTRRVCVGYGKKEILQNIDIEFFKGEFISLLGPNGAGKTTLLRTLSRHLPVLDGTIEINGMNLNSIHSEKLAKIMSVVLTQKVAPPLFQVYDFVAMGRYPHTSWTGKLNKKDHNVVMESLKSVYADDLVSRDISTLSDGERQKVLIARALAQEPAIILLDEPTMHLDLKHRMEIMSILQGLCHKKGICVVASLHDVEIAAKISDKVALLKGNTIQAFGAPEDILQTDTVSDLYDFSNVSFNRLLGNIEIQNKKADLAKVFVIGGMGTASVLYRLLCRKGFQIATGVLFKNDIDYFVAKALGIQCLVQENMDIVSKESIDKAVDVLKGCDFVIDTGFEAGKLNMANLDLLLTALEHKKKIFCMGEKRDILNGHGNCEVLFSKSEFELVSMIRVKESASI